MLNRITLIGNLGRDPEIRYTQAGEAVASFSIATSESWKDKNGIKNEKTQWHQVTVWGGLVEIVKNYLRKGSKVCLAGKMIYEKWTDDKGIERTTAKVVLNNFGGYLEMLDKKPEQSTSEKSDAMPPPPQAGRQSFDDEIPF